MTLQQFLFDTLWRHGVRQVYGLPGDFALNLFEALQRDARFELVRLGHEPAVGFAADGCARITNGLGVCLVTYGAGGLNMINPVACAYAEESPLVVISGGPGRQEKRSGVHVHHEVKSYESQYNAYREVTAFAAILDDPATAASQILRAVDVALKRHRPVYLEVPRDMVFAEIGPPAAAAELTLKVDEAALVEAAREIVERLNTATNPVLIVGVEVHRLRLRDIVIRLAEHLGVPVTSSFLGRGVFPTRHPQFIGTYLGVVSPEPIRRVVEGADYLLLLGELVSDTTLGVSADCLREANLTIAAGRDVFIGHHRYQDVPLDGLVAALAGAGALERRTVSVARSGADLSPEILEPFDVDEPVRMRHVIHVVNEFVERHPEMPVVTDTGDCLFAAVDIRANECVAPAYYATMGFAVPAALGVQTASGRRPLVLVGDGAFQMTGPEISRAGLYRCNPILVLLDNSRWEMLQAFFPDATYNDVVAWPFAKLADLWGGRGFDVRTPGELRAALDAAFDEPRFTLIDVVLEPGDISPILRGFVRAFKQRVDAS